MLAFDDRDYDGETGPEGAEKEARYQELSEGYEFTLEVLSDEELLDQLEFYMKEFIALGDYKDSAEKAEECSIKLKEIQKGIQKELKEELQRETIKVPPKSEESVFGKKCRELKSQIAALTETIKKDEEKIASLKSELSSINAQKPENALKKAKGMKIACPLCSLAGIVLLVLGFVVSFVAKMYIRSIFLCLLALIFLITSLVLWYRRQRSSTDWARNALAQKGNLSSSLDAAMKDLEKHKTELKGKQDELDRHLWGL